MADTAPPRTVAPLAAGALRWRCPLDDLGFETTVELADLDGALGQPRAVEAIDFALAMQRPGYNLYALGPEGIGKHTLVRRALERAARAAGAPRDWCYVANFAEPRKPRALALPAGRGAGFQADMAQLVDDVVVALRSAFESDEHRTRRQVVEEELRERRETALGDVEEAARERGVTLLRTPIGFAFAPVRDGKVVSPDDFGELPEEERKRIESTVEELQERLTAVLRQTPVWMKQAQEKLRRLNDETAGYAVGHLIDELGERYTDLPEVLEHLEAVRGDIIRNVEPFAQAPERPPGIPAAAAETQDGPSLFRRYLVNLLVHHTPGEEGGAAPVVYEDDPTFDRLIGRVEHRAEMGTLVTDLHMIRPGALHRANGGFLILDARKVLVRPLAWEALKRALLAETVRIEPLAQALGLISTVTLEPEPIELSVKVALVGERLLYYLLAAVDPEFSRLFKVAADFDERLDRNGGNRGLYARLVATLVRREGLRPFDRGAVAEVLEQAAREVGDAHKLSTNIEALEELLREADFHAGGAGRDRVGRGDVEAAAESRIQRLDRVRDRIQEEMARGTLRVESEGAVVGQVNGLSVLGLGGFAFGRPSRITARVRLGGGEVVDIEREVELGGPLHSKGVLILGGFLATRYAADRPLSLRASLVFEQSYGGVDGDSASSAELYALLSALAEVPLRQDLAVTGSVDQRGLVQAIGGVNEKIEGFFDLCAARGLTGDQGVLIPAANVQHLMLHRRVIEAVEAGRFQVYPVTTVDQGVELLTGIAAGERGDDGRFPEGSVNRRVEERLLALADARQEFGHPAPEGAGGEEAP